VLDYGDLVLTWSPKKGDTYLVRLTPKASQGTHFGELRHDDLVGRAYGEVALTHKGHPFYLLRPSIAEHMRRIKRQTQILFPKDAGYLLLHLNVTPGCRVLECGTGSGSMACAFAFFVGETGRVVSYDRRPDFSTLARKNAERLDLADRIDFRVRDISEGFDETEADAVFLDVPFPWDYIAQARAALKNGNRLGILVPTTDQIRQVLLALRAEGFVDPEVVEVLLRRWKTEPDRLRPEDTMVGHTGFLILAAKGDPLPEGAVLDLGHRRRPAAEVDEEGQESPDFPAPEGMEEPDPGEAGEIRPSGLLFAGGSGPDV